MTTAVVEIERKYDVGPDTPLPGLEGLPGVDRVDRERYELDATYLDTEDLRLRAAGITLRRRRGGSDAGWHLKLPHGADREEVRHAGGEAGGAPARGGRAVRDEGGRGRAGGIAASGDQAGRDGAKGDGAGGYQAGGQASRDQNGGDQAGRDEPVPLALQALVRSRTRSAALLPVARLHTTRGVHRLVAPDGRVLVEIADDLVRGRTAADEAQGEPGLVWREWEVELVEGPRSLLDDVQERLLAAGASPSGSGSKVGRVLARHQEATGERPWWGRRPVSSPKVSAGAVLQAHLQEQVEELVVRDPQVRRDLPDAVHRMRVATRRLRSALQTFRPLVDRAQADALRAELAWLAGVLGGARDTEVMHARLRELVAREDPELVVGPVAARIDDELGRRYREAHDALLVELEGERYLALLDALAELVADPPFLPPARDRARDVLPGLVRRADRRLTRALADAALVSGQEQDLLLHEARKDAKRARYAAEAVARVYGADARRYAKAVTGVQEVLGEHQDSVVTRQALRELADVAHRAGESSFTFGRLHALEQTWAHSAGAGWPQAAKAASDRKLRTWLRDT